MGDKIYSYLDLCDVTTHACVVTIGGVERAFHRLAGTSVSPPTAGVTPGQQDVASFTYNLADAQGKTVYSACERAVSRYISDNYNQLVNPAWAVIFTAPSDGVIRINGNPTAISVKINGVAQTSAPVNTEATARAYNLAENDVVTVNNGSSTATSTFLPDDYP